MLRTHERCKKTTAADSRAPAHVQKPVTNSSNESGAGRKRKRKTDREGRNGRSSGGAGSSENTKKGRGRRSGKVATKQGVGATG